MLFVRSSAKCAAGAPRTRSDTRPTPNRATPLAATYRRLALVMAVAAAASLVVGFLASAPPLLVAALGAILAVTWLVAVRVYIQAEAWPPERARGVRGGALIAARRSRPGQWRENVASGSVVAPPLGPVHPLNVALRFWHR